MIGCFLDRVFVKFHLSLSGFSPEKNTLPPYFAHKVMQKFRTWWMDIKVWPCFHPEMRMGSREWLWDTLALWESFWASAAVSSRAGSILTWIMRWNFSVGSHSLPATVTCFRGTELSLGHYFKCVLWTFWVLWLTQSQRAVIAAILFWLQFLPFGQIPTPKLHSGRFQWKNVIKAKNCFGPTLGSQNRELSNNYCACSILCSLLHAQKGRRQNKYLIKMNVKWSWSSLPVAYKEIHLLFFQNFHESCTYNCLYFRKVNRLIEQSSFQTSE